MLPILLMVMTTVGGFSYKTSTLFDRTKPVTSAPSGYAATWKEHVQIIAGTDARDAEFSRFMRLMGRKLEEDYYRGDGAEGLDSFETYGTAGSLDVSESLIAASPDIVSAIITASSYEAGMPHPQVQGWSSFVWSRRLHRPLTQNDVFAVAPNRALRRLALSRFDNPEGLQKPGDPDGIPLPWDHASIGRAGITWSFGPYELGGYVSGGSTTIPWSALRPYLRHHLPFVIGAIRAAPDRPGS
ncbi:MAG TPA: hypothetical protein VH331_16330 [Allosphingosinicella sp.]|jgi:hypothetical protein|nr:hypothetical protein [Allosphingosinicella sp.]